ncbi:hypothetical protein I352_06597 [Cryptococcus deuterogattii MMRL2647]|nr:hypothetical protein I352_06597 [Cryptococcus deuterogattii MMRL2647]
MPNSLSKAKMNTFAQAWNASEWQSWQGDPYPRRLRRPS